MKAKGKIQFVVEGNPVTKKNHRPIWKQGSRHVIGKAKALRDYEKSAKAQLMSRLSDYDVYWPIQCPVNVCATFYLNRMPTIFNGNRRGPDLIGLCETIADLLEAAGIVENDALIVGWNGSRHAKDKNRPRTEVTITPVDYKVEVVK